MTSWDNIPSELQPYNRHVTCAQVTRAIRSGLSERAIHRRLLAAECELYGIPDADAYATGWQHSVSAIGGCNDDYYYGDLRDDAEEACQHHRAGCYRSALATGEPSLDIAAYCRDIGRDDCLSAGLLLVEYISDIELAGILLPMPALAELRSLAAQYRAVEGHHARRTVAWTPYGHADIARLGGAVQ